MSSVKKPRKICLEFKSPLTNTQEIKLKQALYNSLAKKQRTRAPSAKTATTSIPVKETKSITPQELQSLKQKSNENAVYESSLARQATINQQQHQMQQQQQYNQYLAQLMSQRNAELRALENRLSIEQLTTNQQLKDELNRYHREQAQLIRSSIKQQQHQPQQQQQHQPQAYELEGILRSPRKTVDLPPSRLIDEETEQQLIGDSYVESELDATVETIKDRIDNLKKKKSELKDQQSIVKAEEDILQQDLKKKAAEDRRDFQKSVPSTLLKISGLKTNKSLKKPSDVLKLATKIKNRGKKEEDRLNAELYERAHNAVAAANIRKPWTPEAINEVRSIFEQLHQDQIQHLGKGLHTALSKDQHATDYSLYDDQIEEYLQPLRKQGFLGVYSADQLYTIPSSALSLHNSVIINLDPSEEIVKGHYHSLPGSHWVALYWDLRNIDSKTDPLSTNSNNPDYQAEPISSKNSNQIHGFYYYDSFGRVPPKAILEQLDVLIKRLKRKFSPELNYEIPFDYNHNRVQNTNSTTCGYFAMKFLINAYLGHNIETTEGQIHKFIDSIN